MDIYKLWQMVYNKVPSKEPIRVGALFSCTTCVFSAKYQSYDILSQWKDMLCFLFVTALGIADKGLEGDFIKKRKNFQKPIDKTFSLCYNMQANKEKFRFHRAAK